MQSWPSKDPLDVLDYHFKWTAELQTGETIVNSTMTLDTGSIVLGAKDVVDLRPTGDCYTTIWISGGTLGERCEVSNLITTSQGRTFEDTAVLRIRRH